MLSLIIREKPDIAYSTLYGSNHILLLSKLFIGSNTKVVVGIATDPKRYESHFFWDLLVRRLYSFADLVICNSVGIKNHILKNWNLDPSKLKNIYNGINIDEINRYKEAKSDFPNINEGDKLIISVGSLRSVKNHKDLIKSTYLINKIIPCTLILVGEGSYSDNQFPYLSSLSKQLDIEKKVIFSMHQVNPFPFISKSDVFVLPSLNEGFPTVLLEAMACGIPAVSYDIDFGPNEIIEHNKSGLLCSKGDLVELSKSIIRLLKNESERITFGFCGKEIVTEGFLLDSMLDKFYKSVKSLIKN